LPVGNPERIVCRCVSVREETIRDAVSRWREPLSVEGVKRRTRAGMGTCQGAFCRPRVKELLADIYQCPQESILVRDESTSPKRPSLVEIKKALEGQTS
jgi:glycerol-3-phosphate dehydrogenase